VALLTLNENDIPLLLTLIELMLPRLQEPPAGFGSLGWGWLVKVVKVRRGRKEIDKR